MSKKFYKSRTDKEIFGVCGGIAEYFETDSTLVRLIAVAAAIASCSFVFWFYLIAALVMKFPPSV